MQPGAGDYVGGYRLIRRLGVGSRGEVWLGHAGSGDEGTRTAALKLYRPDTTVESIDTELLALERGEHQHIVELRDLSSGGDGRPILILERLGPESLSSLLEGRAHISAGEAVTILAPLAAAVEALHHNGISHGSISAARVLFRASGAPVLIGLGHAQLVDGSPSLAMLSSSVGVHFDLKSMAMLMTGVLERVDGAGAGFATALDC